MQFDSPDTLVIATSDGLFCPAGGFWIDPWRPVARAVITHAHGDHAIPGCGSYLTASSGAPLLKARVGAGPPIQSLAFGSPIDLGDVRVSLHPAGHILGSAQIRIERRRRLHGGEGGETWVISGDYKLAPDSTVERFEPIPCDTFITESTFGLPIYRWPDEAGVVAEMNAWWMANREIGRTSIIYAYSLGKAQRVLRRLDPAIGPIGVHGAVAAFCDLYREAGVDLPPTIHANRDTAETLKGSGVIIAPPSAGGSTWLRKFNGPEGASEALVSGWMRVRGRKRWGSVDRGFVLSDHADWPGLISAIEATGADRVGVTHGYADQLARWLREARGLDAFVIPTRYHGELDDEKRDPSIAES